MIREFIKNNAFSKLKKAIRQKDGVEMVNSMLHLLGDPKVAKTQGEFVTRETNRALRHLNLPKTELIQTALDLCKARVGPIWDKPLVEPQAEEPKAA